MDDTKRINFTTRNEKANRKGFSNAVKVGPFIEVGGMTAKMESGEIYGEGDTYSQIKYILERQIQFVISAGGSIHDVYKVRIYGTPEYNREEGEKAFGDVFGDVRPMLSVVGLYELTDSKLLAKIEMSACEGCNEGRIWQGMVLNKTTFDIPETETKPYCAMVKVGPFVYSGTKAVERDLLLNEMENDPITQDDIIYDIHLKLMHLAGISAEDIIKIDSFVLPVYREVYTPKPYSMYAKKFYNNMPLHTTIYVSTLEKVKQLVSHELFGIVGCGSIKDYEDRPEEWGELDLRRENFVSGAELEKSNGFSRLIKAGPFIYSGGTTAVKSDGSVLCEKDSTGQESVVLNRLFDVLIPIGVKPENIILCRAYRTSKYQDYKQKKVGVYEEKLKPVRPVYTGVYTEGLHQKSQLVEFEIQAVLGCDQEKMEQVQL